MKVDYLDQLRQANENLSEICAKLDKLEYLVNVENRRKVTITEQKDSEYAVPLGWTIRSILESAMERAKFQLVMILILGLILWRVW